jgi:hypothetical protein
VLCAWTRRAAHLWYESSVDNFIDEQEFLAGMQKLGLDFGPGSLGLSDAQQKAVMAHVFSSPASADVPLSQLVRLTGNSFILDQHQRSSSRAILLVDLLSVSYVLRPSCVHPGLLSIAVVCCTPTPTLQQSTHLDAEWWNHAGSSCGAVRGKAGSAHAASNNDV